jgi:hypothetical protein
MDSRSILTSVIAELKGQNAMPKRIDLSKIGNRYWCVASDFDVDSVSIMNEDITTGFSNEKEIAVLKALSERAERKAFLNGFRKNILSCQTERSDGFAAMPDCLSSDRVRDNALNEAIERYVWAYWWDHAEIAFNNVEIPTDNPLIQNSKYLKDACKGLKIEQLFLLEPEISILDKTVKILFAKMKGLGFISGGACGPKSEGQEVLLRAFDELYRHGFAYMRSLEKKIKAKSFYENRLNFFASGSGNQIVENRLSLIGKEKISLPKLKIDNEVPSPFQGFKIHRCYFENQPMFVGGHLERLCL